MSLPALLGDRHGPHRRRPAETATMRGASRQVQHRRIGALFDAFARRPGRRFVRWRPLDEGAVSGTAMLAAFVVASDKSRIGDKAVQAMEITQTIARVAVNNDWGLADCRPAEDHVESANLYRRTPDERASRSGRSVGGKHSAWARPDRRRASSKAFMSGGSPAIGKRHKDDYREVLP